MTDDKERPRCSWVDLSKEYYVHYHDEEWGAPVHDDRVLFEMLVMENFQAGLSWECVLRKRDAFREAFDGFDVAKVAAYDEAKMDALAENPGIIRNRQKIRAAVKNARIFRAIQEEWGSFDRYLWHWTEGRTIIERGEVRSALSDALSKDLKKRGMSFVGSVTMYAYLQAAGVINAHEEDCFRYQQLVKQGE